MMSESYKFLVREMLPVDTSIIDKLRDDLRMHQDTNDFDTYINNYVGYIHGNTRLGRSVMEISGVLSHHYASVERRYDDEALFDYVFKAGGLYALHLATKGLHHSVSKSLHGYYHEGSIERYSKDRDGELNAIEAFDSLLGMHAEGVEDGSSEAIENAARLYLPEIDEQAEQYFCMAFRMGESAVEKLVECGHTSMMAV